MKNILFLQKNNDKNIIRNLSDNNGVIKIKTFIEEFDKENFLKKHNEKLEINHIEICNDIEESDKKIFYYLRQNKQKYIQITSVYIDKTNKKSIISGIKHDGNDSFSNFSCPLNSLDIDIEDIKSILTVVCENIFVSTYGFRFFHDSEKFSAKDMSDEYINHILQLDENDIQNSFELDSLNEVDNAIHNDKNFDFNLFDKGYGDSLFEFEKKFKK